MLNSLNGNGLSNFGSQNPAPFLDQKGNPFHLFKTGLPLSSWIQPQPPRTGGLYAQLAAPRSDYSGYLSGADTKPLNRREVSDLYGKVANGSLSISPDQFDRLLQSNSDTKGIDTNEWSHYSPEYQSWARSNPQAFLSDALAHRNPANNDLGSMGAEGGYANPAGIKPGGDYSNAGYMQIHDDGGFLGGLGPVATIASMIPGPWQVPAMALNAANSADQGNWGGAIASVMGMPGVGSGITNSLSSGLQGLGVASSVAPYVSKGLISAGGTALGGGDLKQSLTNGVASGLGTFAGNQVAGAIGSSLSPAISTALSQGTAGALGTAIKGGDVLKSGLLSGINGLAQGAASGMDNGALKSLVKSSPGLLNTIMASQNRGSPSAPSAPAPQQAQMPDWVRQAMVALGKKGYTEAQAKQMIQQRGRG